MYAIHESAGGLKVMRFMNWPGGLKVMRFMNRLGGLKVMRFINRPSGLKVIIFMPCINRPGGLKVMHACTISMHLLVTLPPPALLLVHEDIQDE